VLKESTKENAPREAAPLTAEFVHSLGKNPLAI